MTPDQASPFHEGERAMQGRAGTRARMEVAGPHLIRDHMPDQHRELFEKLPYLIAGIADAIGQPWATMLTGAPGFVTTTPRTMQIADLPADGDPARQALQPGASVGILGIELTTRRRNRMNGRVSAVQAEGFGIDVVQSFGNCPKYIQIRAHHHAEGGLGVTRRDEAPLLSAEARALVAGSDTFFIATASGRDGADWTRGVDVSHRGGAPGFVQVGEAASRTVLTVADYAGNGFFNTFGNLALEPRAGLLFVDFARGHLLQLAVRGKVVWSEASEDQGTGRTLTLEVVGGHWLRDAVSLRWI